MLLGGHKQQISQRATLQCIVSFQIGYFTQALLFDTVKIRHQMLGQRHWEEPAHSPVNRPKLIMVD